MSFSISVGKKLQSGEVSIPKDQIETTLTEQLSKSGVNPDGHRWSCTVESVVRNETQGGQREPKHKVKMMSPTREQGGDAVRLRVNPDLGDTAFEVLLTPPPAIPLKMLRTAFLKPGTGFQRLSKQPTVKPKRLKPEQKKKEGVLKSKPKKKKEQFKALEKPYEPGMVGHVDWRAVQPMPGQPRIWFDPVKLEQLKKSIEDIGQQEPAQVVPWDDGTLRIRDGERRWRCCRTLDFPYYVVVKERRSENEEFELALTANLHREEHSTLERAKGMLFLKEEMGYTYAQIAQKLGCTTGTVQNYLQLFRSLDKRVLRFLDPRREEHGKPARVLQHTVALELTPFKEHPNEQYALAVKIVHNKMTLSQARSLIRRRAREMGITKGRGLSKRPSDHKANLLRALRGFGTRVETFLSLSVDELERMVEGMSEEQREGLVKIIRVSQSHLENLHRVLREAGIDS